jgi:hypothetical protein
MILTDLPPIGVPQLLESMETAVSNEEDLR